jgi:hypothetical protein
MPFALEIAMEIQTDPFTEELVTDLIIGFATGAVKDFVLHAADVLEEREDRIIVKVVVGAYPDTIVFYKAHIAWHSVMQRVIRRKVVGMPVAADKLCSE